MAFAQGDDTGDGTTQDDPNDPNDPNDGSDAATEAQIDWTFELQDATNAANYTFQSTTNGDETFVAASGNTDVKTGSLGANTSKGKLKILLNDEEVVTCYLQYAIKHAKDGKNDIQFQKNKPAETNLDEGVYAYAIFPASKGLSKFGIKFLETDNKKVNLYVSTATAMPTSASEMTQIVSNVAAGTQLTWSDFEFTGTGDGDDKIEPKDVKWVM